MEAAGQEVAPDAGRDRLDRLDAVGHARVSARQHGEQIVAVAAADAADAVDLPARADREPAALERDRSRHEHAARDPQAWSDSTSVIRLRMYAREEPLRTALG